MSALAAAVSVLYHAKVARTQPNWENIQVKGV